IGIEKCICRIERVIAQKIKTGAVKIVAAAFCDQVDDSALRLSIFGAEAITLDTELCDRIDRGKHKQGGIRTDVHVVDAVDGPEIGIRLIAVHRHVNVGVEAGTSGGETARLRNTGHHQSELRVVATIERQLRNLLLRNKTADFTTTQFDGSRLAGDSYSLRHLAHL